MKTKPNRLRGYINHGAIPTNEYTSAAMNQTPETDVSDKAESGSEQEATTNQARAKLSVKARPRQKFRQARAGKQKTSGTSLGWRTNRASRRSIGSDHNR